MAALNITVTPITRRLLRVEFNDDVIIDSISEISDYSASIYVGSGDSVEVKGVQGLDSDADFTSTVDVHITTPTMGSIYSLTISNIYLRDSSFKSSVSGLFVGRDTKTDSIISKFPAMYNLDLTNSNLAQVCAAIGMADDVIGKSTEDVDESPVGSTYYGTLGSLTLGTGTFGGGTP